LAHAGVGRLLGYRIAGFHFGYGKVRRSATVGQTLLELRGGGLRSSGVRFTTTMSGWRGLVVTAAGPAVHAVALIGVLVLGDPWSTTPRFAVALGCAILLLRNLMPVPTPSGRPSDGSTMVGFLRAQRQPETARSGDNLGELMVEDPLGAIARVDKTLASPHVTREQWPPLLWVRSRCLITLERYVEAVEVLAAIIAHPALKPLVLAERREATLAAHLLGQSESDPWTLAGTLDVANTWLALAEAQGKTLHDSQMGLAQGRLTVAMGLVVTGDPVAALQLCTALARDIPNDRRKRVVHGVMGFAHAESGDLERARRVLAGLRLDAPDSVWTTRLAQALDAAVPPATSGGVDGFAGLSRPGPSAMHVLNRPEFTRLMEDVPGAAAATLEEALARANLSEAARANLLSVRSSCLNAAGRYVEQLADLQAVASIRPWHPGERHNFWDGVLSAHVLHQQVASELVLGKALAESSARLEQLESAGTTAVELAAVLHTVALAQLATGDPATALELAMNAAQDAGTARSKRSVAATVGLAHLATGEVQRAGQISDELTLDDPDGVWTRGLAQAVATAAAAPDHAGGATVP
jgi:hypothetical protein